ncbi:MAG: YdcF family protein [Chitinophagaceae bacterium]
MINFTQARSRFLFVALFFLLTSVAAVAQQYNAPSSDYNLVRTSNLVQQKNYYLLTLFQELPAVRKLLEQDTELKRIASDKIYNLSHAQDQCNLHNRFCYTDNIKFTAEEITAIGRRLADLYATDNPLGKLVTEHLAPSGTYILYSDLSPLDMLIKAWEQDAQAVNYAIALYAEGVKPRYPKIDSISFNVLTPQYMATVRKTSKDVLQQVKNSSLFFQPTMQFALQFLDINGFRNAADLEPLETSVNKSIVARIKTINWDDYNYTVILVPGAGPESAKIKLSEEGKLRCKLAADHFKAKRAPFVVVSGGRVHPYKTKYYEAVEMKKYMVDSLGIPENAVIIEPHARHTTTNMRNCARLIYRYGMPLQKSCLVTTSAGQSFYILEIGLDKRSEQELGYVPFKKGMRLNKNDVVFYPQIASLQIGSVDPLDP